MIKRVIGNKIKREAPDLLAVGKYQNWFKEGKQTAINIAEVIKFITADKNRYLLLVDFMRAFYKLDREKLGQILQNRAKTEE